MSPIPTSQLPANESKHANTELGKRTKLETNCYTTTRNVLRFVSLSDFLIAIF